MRKRYILVPISLLAGLAYILWDGGKDTPVVEVPRNALLEEEPDYYGDNLKRRQFNAQGKLAQTFIAKRSEHYPIAQHTHFQQPHIVTTNDQGRAWQIDAEEGEMSDKEQLLTLINNIEIRPLNDPDNQDLLIETSRLTYKTDTQVASTDQPVQITNTDTKINAVGMNLNVPNQTLELLQQVNTRYAPPPTE